MRQSETGLKKASLCDEGEVEQVCNCVGGIHSSELPKEATAWSLNTKIQREGDRERQMGVGQPGGGDVTIAFPADGTLSC